MIRLLVPIALIVGACALAAGAKAPPDLRALPPVDVGSGPGVVLLADFNADGRLDLLTKHILDKKVGVHLGDGKGGFRVDPARILDLDYQPAAVAAGDVNGDGKLDVALASWDEQHERVRIYLGDGKGGLALRPGPLALIRTARQFYKPNVRLLDLDGDGKLDLVMINGRFDEVDVLKGDGAGGFGAGRTVHVGFAETARYFSQVEDLDGDRRADLLAIGGDQNDPGPLRLVLKRGDGHGDFLATPAAKLRPGMAPRIAVGDLDGDGRPDLVLTEDRSVSVMLNAGDGSFRAAPELGVTLDREAFAAAVADFNGDGRADLAVATVGSLTVLVATKRGFVEANGSPFRAGPGAYNLDVGDLNGDGKSDVVVSSLEGRAVRVLLGS